MRPAKLLASKRDHADAVYTGEIPFSRAFLEAEYALKYEESIIGINNRDLKSLNISLDNTIRIQKKLISHKGPLVSESGIKNKIDAQYIYDKTGIKNFLIGESLLASGETDKLIKEIISISL